MPDPRPGTIRLEIRNAAGELTHVGERELHDIDATAAELTVRAVAPIANVEPIADQADGASSSSSSSSSPATT